MARQVPILRPHTGCPGLGPTLPIFRVPAGMKSGAKTVQMGEVFRRPHSLFVGDMTSKERFEKLSLPHLEVMYRLAMRLAGNDAEAEDLVQETLYRAYRSFDKFELREYGAKPWLLRILHNVFFTRRGRQARQPILLDEVELDHFRSESAENDSITGGWEEFSWEDVDEEIMQAVNALQPEYRSVLLLWALEDMSYKEIAQSCDCAIGTVMSRLYRARQALSRELAAFAAERNLAGPEHPK